MKGPLARLAALIACLLLAGVLAWFGARSPEPQPPTAPDNGFSAGRAYLDVQAIAERPHPLGSAEHEAVRAYLLQRLRGLGLQAIERPGHAIEDRTTRSGRSLDGGDLVNLVAILPGRDRTLPALAIMSHYDSVPNSPGAADDAAGVASTLEIARALKLGGQPARDVMFVITDGEEAGLLGARAFFDTDPIAGHVGAVLNMEARGGGGRTYMFQTAPKNGAWIDLFERTSVSPSSNSLAVFLYSLMPNDTDFTVALAHGKPGLNYAFIGRQFDYHAASSTPANLDRGSLQHMGEQVLAAAQDLAANSALPGKAADAVYADVLGGVILAYPAWAGWLVLLACAGLVALAAVRVRASEGLPWRDVVAGAGGGLYVLFVSIALFELIRHATGAPIDWTGGRPVLARFGLYEIALALGAFALALVSVGALKYGGLRIAGAVFALVLGLLPSLFGGLDITAAVAGVLAAALSMVIFWRPLQAWAAWFGVLAVGILAALVLQVAAPTTAFLVQWPLLLAAVLAVLMSIWRKGWLGSPPAMLAAVLVAAAGMAQVIYLAHGVTVGVGADLPAAPAVFVLLGLLLMFPLLWLQDIGRIVELAALTAVVLIVVFMRLDPSTARHPRATHVIFVQDPVANRAWRVSQLRHPDRWTREALTADGGKVQRGQIDTVTTSGVMALATPFPAAKPYAKLEREPGGRVVLRLDPTPGARQLRVWLRGPGASGAATLNGLPVRLAGRPDQWTRITWNGPRGGLELAIEAQPHGAIEARWGVLTEGWPKQAKPLPPRPSKAMPWDDSDSTVLIGTLNSKW